MVILILNIVQIQCCSQDFKIGREKAIVMMQKYVGFFWGGRGVGRGGGGRWGTKNIVTVVRWRQ